MAEASWICNHCNDGKIYTSIEADKHKLETERRGVEHNSFRMLKRKDGIRDTEKHN